MFCDTVVYIMSKIDTTHTNTPLLEVVGPQKDYELIDSGNGRKLERFKDVVLSRPDPQALWEPFLSNEKWDSADAYFVRKGNSTEWKFNNPNVPKEWIVSFENISLWVKPTSFKHTGVFPEQISNWKWMSDTISSSSQKDIKVLNLFGYTGGASLVCAKAGAQVTHIDGSKASVGWAKDNAELSGLEHAPIRYLIDDVRAFVSREIRRGNTYHGIIMDPPSFGYGPKDEPWKIEEHLKELMDLVSQILDKDALFVVLNGYASGFSSISYLNMLENVTGQKGGTVEHGELALMASSNKRLLPAGIFARWRK